MNAPVCKCVCKCVRERVCVSVCEGVLGVAGAGAVAFADALARARGQAEPLARHAHGAHHLQHQQRQRRRRRRRRRQQQHDRQSECASYLRHPACLTKTGSGSSCLAAKTGSGQGHQTHLANKRGRIACCAVCECGPYRVVPKQRDRRHIRLRRAGALEVDRPHRTRRAPCDVLVCRVALPLVRTAAGLQENGLFLRFACVCPEPVLVKCSFLYINGFKRPSSHRHGVHR
eukprot:COSAG06_NODE_1351_length_9765_cov_3.151976_8_plen_230_part_00